MKKFLFCILACLVLFSFLSSDVSAQKPIEVFVDGSKLHFDVQPQLIDGRTMVPLRPIFEALLAEITWDDSTGTVTATKENHVILLTIGKKNLFIDGIPKEMDIAPILMDNRTLIPVRFVAEALDCIVTWNATENTVSIISAYPGTKVPTYTSITGIPLKECQRLSNGQIAYIYNYSHKDYLGNYYSKLYETGWTPYLHYANITDAPSKDEFPLVHIKNAVILMIRPDRNELWIGF